MFAKVLDNEVFGFIRPVVDVHTLGISTIGKLLEDCGYRVCIGDTVVVEAVGRISKVDNISLLGQWIEKNRITRLGFSYRLDPEDAQKSFGKVFHLLKEHHHFKDQGGLLKQIYFAGLPKACKRIALEYHNQVVVFSGDETQIESLKKIGIPDEKIPQKINIGSKYDEDRLIFAKTLIKS
jgi:hypothetical protein